MKNKMKTFMALATVAVTALSQPVWVLGCPKEGYRDFYFCGWSMDHDFKSAQAKAIENAVLKIQRVYSVKVDLRLEKSATFDNSRVVISLKSEEEKIPIRLADTYYQRLGNYYKVWVLIAVPKPEKIAKREPSDLDAAIRSIIFPGWGQFIKGRPDRAIFFIAAETISAGLTMYFSKNSNYSNYKLYAKISLWVSIGIHIANIIDSITISNKNLR